MRTLLRVGKAGMLMTALTVLGIVLLLGCGGGQTPQEAEAKLCQDLAAFEASVAQLGQIGPGTTVDELQSIKNDIATSFGKVKESAAQVAGARVGDLEQAEANLENAINGIPGDASIQEALAMIQPEVVAVVVAWGQLAASVNCGPTVTPGASPAT